MLVKVSEGLNLYFLVPGLLSQMSDSDLMCQDLFWCGFMNYTEVSLDLHCFEMGLGYSSASVF